MLIEPQFRSAAADRIWSLDARVHRMLAFEAALAAAQASCGLVPAGVAALIAEVCAGPQAEHGAAFADAALAGNPAIPFVKRLTAAVAERDAEAARFVHYGATSQDVIDTALVLGLRETAAEAEARLLGTMRSLARDAERHLHTPIAARTLLQQATPITFGLKAATWLAMAARARSGLAALAADAFAVQLGGATGTLSTMGDAGPAVRAGLAERLALRDPGACWHTSRDRLLAIGTAFTAVAGCAAKIAGDGLLMMQSEIGELHESAAPGRGGSSAMPHKRNPVDALVPTAILPAVAGHLATLAATQAQAHERAAGAWHAEWLALPSLAALSLVAAERLEALVGGFEIDTERMRANLALHRGVLAAESLAAALAPVLGRSEAHRLVEHLSQRTIAERRPFGDLVHAESAIARAIEPSRLQALLAYAEPLAAAAAEARRLLDRHRPE